MSSRSSSRRRDFRRHAAVALGAVGVFSGFVAVTTSHAVRQEFFLNDPQKLSAASITIDSPLRPLRGFISEIGGSLYFDPEKPGSVQADVEIPLDNLRIGSYLVTEVLLSDRCLDVANYPVAKFTIKGVKDIVQFAENSWSFTARAALVLRGRAGGFEFPATLVYVPDGMTERTNGEIDGDLVVLRGDLEFQPANWGVGFGSDIIGEIGEHVEVNFSAIGYTMRSGRRSGN